MGTDMRTLQLVKLHVDIIPPLLLDGGLHVLFLQAIPLDASELRGSLDASRRRRRVPHLCHRGELRHTLIGPTEPASNYTRFVSRR
jgi:hypothetical protein